MTAPGNGERVLFIRYSALGDVIQAAPFARRLKESFPGMHLTWLITRPLDLLVRGQPFVDDVLVWDRSRGERGFFDLIREVRRGSFDRLVSAQSSDRGALVAFLSGIPWRCGSHPRFSGIYHRSQESLREELAVPGVRGALAVPTTGREEIPRTLSGIPPVRVGFAIGASKPAKRWPEARWRAVAEGLGLRGVGVVLLGDGEEERALGDAVAHGLPFVRNAVSAFPLDRILGAVGSLQALVGGDSGLLHMALALGIPAVGLFGPSLPEQVGLGAVDRSLLADCPRKGCGLWDCPQGCLGNIAAESVLHALDDLIPDVGVRTRRERD